jgi:hypothetical protein
MSVHAFSLACRIHRTSKSPQRFGIDGGRARRGEATVKAVGNDEDDGRRSRVRRIFVAQHFSSMSQTTTNRAAFKSVFFVTLAQSSVSVDVSLGVRRGDPVILQNTGE